MNPKWQIRKGGRKNSAYEKFVRTKPCCVQGCPNPIELNHVWNRRVDSYSVTAICRRHHTGRARGDNSYHGLGSLEKFEAAHNICLLEIIYEQLTEFIELERKSPLDGMKIIKSY